MSAGGITTCLPRQHAQWRNVERSHQHGQSHSRSLSFNHLPGGLQHRHTSDGQRFNKHLVGQMCRHCLFIPTSGVTSLGAKPVPPVVRIRLSSSSSHHSNRVSWNTQTGVGGSVSQWGDRFLTARFKQRRQQQAPYTHLDFIDLIWNDLVG